jgi:hypothetical protein
LHDFRLGFGYAELVSFCLSRWLRPAGPTRQWPWLDYLCRTRPG